MPLSTDVTGGRASSPPLLTVALVVAASVAAYLLGRGSGREPAPGPPGRGEGAGPSGPVAPAGEGNRPPAGSAAGLEERLAALDRRLATLQERLDAALGTGAAPAAPGEVAPPSPLVRSITEEVAVSLFVDAELPRLESRLGDAREPDPDESPGAREAREATEKELAELVAAVRAARTRQDVKELRSGRWRGFFAR